MAHDGDELGSFDQFQEPARKARCAPPGKGHDESIRRFRRPVLRLVEGHRVVDPETFGSQSRGLDEFPVRGSVETVGSAEQLPAGLLGQVGTAVRAGEERHSSGSVNRSKSRTTPR